MSSLYERALARDTRAASIRPSVRSHRSVASRSSSTGPRARTSSTPTGAGYLDYVQSWGASILGHAHPTVVEAVQRAAAAGTSYGAPTAREVELAEAIAARVPSVEKVRLVSSGTEAGMTVVRLARGATGRSKILKFAGCYHGHVDALLVAAGSGVATLGLPGSAGVTEGDRRRHGRRPLQRRRRPRRRVRALRRRPRGGDRRTRRRQHGPGAARRRLPRPPARALHRSGRAPRLRRGDHRVPPRARPARRASTGSRPTSRCSARWWAAASRSPRSAGAPT